METIEYFQINPDSPNRSRKKYNGFSTRVTHFKPPKNRQINVKTLQK